MQNKSYLDGNEQLLMEEQSHISPTKNNKKHKIPQNKFNIQYNQNKLRKCGKNLMAATPY